MLQVRREDIAKDKHTPEGCKCELYVSVCSYGASADTHRCVTGGADQGDTSGYQHHI